MSVVPSGPERPEALWAPSRRVHATLATANQALPRHVVVPWVEKDPVEARYSRCKAPDLFSRRRN